LVAFVGAPGAPALGPLDGNLEERARRLERLATSYRGGRTVLPVMELIVVTAQGAAGPDGKYRSRIDPKDIDRYLAVARKHKMLLMLDVQPGQAKPSDEIRRLVKSVDGIGARGAKAATYRQLTTTPPKGVHLGFKLFHQEDTRHGALMTPGQVLALRPRPELVIYE
jgi:hypothetical protein